MGNLIRGLTVKHKLLSLVGFYVLGFGTLLLLSWDALSAAKATVAVIIVTIVSLMSWLTVRRMVRPLEQAAETIRKISEHGDLAQRLDTQGEDEAGELAQWFNMFMDELHDVMTQFIALAGRVATAAEELAGQPQRNSRQFQQRRAQDWRKSSRVPIT